ncbi:hypothetical protein D6Z83_26585 [Pseudoroseomonas wenyumeiae]|uniref:Uncharacterized protein n=1 Tax=Teichococcus wenyumeiae TaxID=2478470 RepID=A0A3A9J3W5_9PROT|nr:hypothetical protein D6Z83_26585 [Pseudoroseomonas wenyumeiae]
MVRGQPEVAADLRAVAAAAERRLGPEGLGQITTASAAEAAAPSREGLAGIGRAVAVMREGQRAYSGDHDRLFQPKVITQSGDHDHLPRVRRGRGWGREQYGRRL